MLATNARSRGGWKTLAVALALFGLVGVSDAQRKKKGAPEGLHWQGETHALDALPEELPAEAAEAVETWSGWAQERGYHMELSDDGRVLFLAQSKKRPAKQMKLVEETLERFDELLPAPDRTAASADDGAKPIPASARRTTWRNDGPPLDTETAILIEANSQRDYAAALDLVGEQESYLSSWIGSAKEMSGFALERPLCAAWLEHGKGSEEWSAENELVHRLARLLTTRRFGHQPPWVTLGVGWHLEMEASGSIYCYPGREGFVWASEHDSWPKRLQNQAKKNRSGFLIEDIAKAKPRAFDEAASLRAWGTVHFLAKHRPGALTAILEDFRRIRDEKGIVTHANGSWERIPGFEVSAEDQSTVLRKHAGDDSFDELEEAFRKGKRYKPKKSKKR